MAEITQAIAIQAPRERVFPLVASGEGFTKWWAADMTEYPATGTVELGFFNRATVYKLRPVRKSIPSKMEWLCETGQEWAGTTLIFELVDAHSGTQLQFAHSGWKSETDYFRSCTKAWAELMLRLKAAAEGKERGPHFSKDGLAP